MVSATALNWVDSIQLDGTWAGKDNAHQTS